MVVVARGDSVAMGEEVDGFIWGDVELMAKLAGQIGSRVNEAFGINVGHWEEDLAHVDPPAPGSYRDPVGQKPCMTYKHLSTEWVVWIA